VALKNPVGKSYQVATPPSEFSAIQQSSVKSGAREPLIVFGAIASPMNQVLETLALLMRIWYFLHKVFFKSIRGDNGLGLFKFVTRE